MATNVYSRMLPPPPVAKQRKETCWAACMASLLAITGNRRVDFLKILNTVRSHEQAPGQLVDQNTGAYIGNVNTLFEIFDVRSYGMTFFGEEDRQYPIAELIMQNNYIFFGFTDPDWGTDKNGKPLWHIRVLYGFYEGPSGSSVIFFRGMEPDPMKPAYVVEGIYPDKQYFIGYRQAVSKGKKQGV